MINLLRRKIEAKLHAGDVKRMIAKGRIPDPISSLERLKKLGFRPQLVFDVGAYHGDFTQICIDLWPEAQIHAFEALPEKTELLKSRFKQKNVVVKKAIVGESKRDNVEFYSDETSSSVLESQEFTPKKRLRQEMIRLDDYINDHNLRAPDFLKIDTQGYEYQVLKGLGKYITSVQIILAEVNFIEIYHNVNLAHEVIRLLNSYGFVIYDICEIHRRPLDMALFQIDFLFVKQDSYLRNDKRWDLNTK